MKAFYFAFFFFVLGALASDSHINKRGPYVTKKIFEKMREYKNQNPDITHVDLAKIFNVKPEAYRRKLINRSEELKEVAKVKELAKLKELKELAGVKKLTELKELIEIGKMAKEEKEKRLAMNKELLQWNNCLINYQNDYPYDDGKNYQNNYPLSMSYFLPTNNNYSYFESPFDHNDLVMEDTFNEAEPKDLKEQPLKKIIKKNKRYKKRKWSKMTEEIFHTMLEYEEKHKNVKQCELEKMFNINRSTYWRWKKQYQND